MALALAAFGFLALAIWLFVSPLFRWQTAFVTLAVKDYHLGTVAPVPFFDEDMAAFTATLSPSLHSRAGNKPVTLSGMESVESLRRLLTGRIKSLPLRPKDVLVAYVRGQSIVAPPLLSRDGESVADDDRLSGRACMLAADFRVHGDRPTEIIAWREIIDSLASGWFSQTLVALDLGDLEWDPRLGVLANVVAKQLDIDFTTARPGDVGQNWVIGSHDLFGASMTSARDRRTLFARALELGLSGSSDAKPWGNENGVVELDELAHFMTCQIANWSIELTGGRSQQRPVVWKLGVGRVPVSDIPKGIAVIRVASGRKTATESGWWAGWTAPAKPATAGKTNAPTAPGEAARQPSGGAAQSGKPAGRTAGRTAGQAAAGTPPAPANRLGEPDAVPRVAAPSATTPAAEAASSASNPPAEAAPSAAPEAVASAQSPGAAKGTANVPPFAEPAAEESGATSVLQRVRSQLDRLSTRRDTAYARESRLVPIDYAPHVWNRLANMVGEAEVRLRIAEGLFDQASFARSAEETPAAAGEGQADTEGRRIRAFLDQISRQLASIPSSAPNATSSITETTTTDSVLVEDLRVARDAADTRGMFRLWSATPPMLQNAVAIRDDAVATTLEAVNFIGKYSAGAGPAIIDPVVCRALAEQARELSRLLTELSGSSLGRDDALSVRLKAATRACEVQTAWLKELVGRSVLPVGKRSLRYVPDDDTESSMSFRQWRASLQSLLFSDAQRSQLLPTGFPILVDELAAGAAPERGQLEPTGLDRLPIDLPVRIDRRSLDNISQLIHALATVADAAGIDVSASDRPPSEVVATIREIAALRSEAAALGKLDGNDVAALDGIVRLGGRAARVFARVAAAIAQSGPGASSGSRGSDQLGALLRIVDYRDVSSLPRNLLVSLPLSPDEAQSEVAFQTPDGVRLRRGADIRAVIEFFRLSDTPSLDRVLRLNYDPAVIQVRSATGELLQPNAPLDIQQFASQTSSMELRLMATGALPASGAGETARLVALWERGQGSQRAVLDLTLPDRRDIVLATRRTPAATSRSKVNLPQAAGVADDAWEFSAPIRFGDDEKSPFVSTMMLSALPGRVTAWELGLFNAASFPRDVSLEIHSLPSRADASERESVWRDAAAALLDGTWHGEPIATIPKLTLAKSGDVVSVDIPPAVPAAPAASATPAATVASPTPPVGGSSKDVMIGPDLAVIIRESTPGQPAAAWLTRLILTPEHPRSRLEAHATWKPIDRTIVVTVAAAESPDTKNPDTKAGRTVTNLQNVELSLDALTWGPASRRQPLVVRKGAASLGPGRPLDTMVATWNGGAQDGRAWLHVDVDGYPRAFVFAVDCSPATAGELQRPQFDWRCVNILRPEEKQLVLKAPAADLPIRLAVDVPADAEGDGVAAASEISLTMREVNAASVLPGLVHPVWRTSADRQTLFAREKAVGRATLAVRTIVQDWEVNAAGLGFKDVDVVAEASVIVPGAQTPLTDRRLFTMDARPPVVEVPPLMNVVIGRPLVVPVRVTDDPRESSTRAPGSHIAGVSGVARVEWGLDLKGDGAPAAWQPAVGLGGEMYEVRLDTTKLPPGTRLPLFVRATDRVGLSNVPEPVWLDSAPSVAKNGIRGKVVLNGLAEEGVLVSLSGPGEPSVVTSGTNGVFQFPDLEPGEYTLQATGAVRNRTYRSEEAKVSVEAPPASEVSITLQLK